MLEAPALRNARSGPGMPPSHSSMADLWRFPKAEGERSMSLRIGGTIGVAVIAAISEASMSIFDQGGDSTDLRGSIALRGCGMASSVTRYPRNWASSLRELSAFAVCSVSFA